jgi:hypothetical protein
MPVSDVARQRRRIKRRLLDAARADLGYAERSNNDTKFGRWYGLNFQPWCAMALSYWAAKAGLQKIIPRHAYTPAGADWFKERGLWGSEPRVGAIAYYDTSGLGRISHVGVVEKVLRDGSWYAIEGNTNAAGSREGRVVRRQHRTTVGRRGGFAYPDYTAQAQRELAA